MNAMKMLLTQRQNTWNGEGWFVSLRDVLDGLGPAHAAWQPPGGGNTIWQTLNHMNYYNERLVCRLTGTPFSNNLSNDETFGPSGNPEDRSEWDATVQRTREIADRLHEVLTGLKDEDLDTRPGSEAVLWVMHDAYHTGQIALIRKQQGSWPLRS